MLMMVATTHAKHAVSERESLLSHPSPPHLLSLKCGGPLLRLLDARVMHERDGGGGTKLLCDMIGNETRFQNLFILPQEEEV